MRLGKNPSLILGGGLVAILLLAALIGPLLVHTNPNAIDMKDALAGPSAYHIFGCDALGRDVFARVVWGARLSLTVSMLVIGLSLAIGSLVGGAAALAGGNVDSLVMRGVDIVLAFPGFLLAIALAAILGPGIESLVIALAAMGWTGYARLVRGEVLSLKEREYVAAATALGASRTRVLFRHMLPGLVGPVAVQATFGIGGIIVAEAALSFLGLGVLPPTPSWESMLNAGRAFLLIAPHITTAPGVAIGVAVLGFNLLGDGLAQLAGTRS